ncbi:NADPH-dependent FMN reductase [Nocardia huaxiensis]|uniref:NAD(P)H-dependent oxidoreductase n=1 Tax=Nocardia huaxiensis TaxID=2755382 RepID=A0A7D6ZSS5_9NOCA|nr:NAD(P)H-dependent oxidoreductase [Nocardia huaxiensis]QLY33045.1 NAD(P)H-dependent oxidoreductase [Nocardia huaxiensis]UFS93192.1 NAD(P)H-dependent oxidoreductase [Nocardia huaxiensis]
MSSRTLRLAVIIGSVREGRFGPTVASWFAGEARKHGGFEVDVIDLADYTVPVPLPAVPLLMEPNPERHESMGDLTRRVAAADAVVIVTPDINRSYPASLKSAIDWHWDEWDRKVVGFVGYSGKSGGMFAIEHLRQIFAEMNAHAVRDYVSLPKYYQLFGADGTLLEPADFEYAAKSMLDQMHWWARAVAGARELSASA